MTKLTLDKAYKIADNAVGYKRHITVKYKTKIIGWTVHEDKSQITVKTEKLNSVPPYVTNVRQKTVNINDPNNIKKLQQWLDSMWY